MDQILAPCGIDCLICPAYQATQEGEIEKLRTLIDDWVQDDTHYEPEDLLCDGCYSERVSKDCRLCWIKDCVKEKELDTCANCGDYPCERLKHDWGEWQIMSGVDAKARLDEMKNHSSLM